MCVWVHWPSCSLVFPAPWKVHCIAVNRGSARHVMQLNTLVQPFLWCKLFSGASFSLVQPFLWCSAFPGLHCNRSRGKFISLFTLDLDLKEFSFHFSFSISISRHFHFTFHSRNEWNWFSFHVSLLEMSEQDFHFTFHFSNFQYSLSQDTGLPTC